MLKKTITFEDLDGNLVTDDFYFHLSKAEIAEMELTKTGGLETYIRGIVAAEDRAEIVKFFKQIISMSVGARGADGRQFIKNDEVRDAFEQTDAYSVLFMELATDADAGAAFINGIVPRGMNPDSDKPAPPVIPTPRPDVVAGETVPTPKDLTDMTEEQLRARRAELQAQKAAEGS